MRWHKKLDIARASRSQSSAHPQGQSNSQAHSAKDRCNAAALGSPQNQQTTQTSFRSNPPNQSLNKFTSFLFTSLATSRTLLTAGQRFLWCQELIYISPTEEHNTPYKHKMLARRSRGPTFKHRDHGTSFLEDAPKTVGAGKLSPEVEGLKLSFAPQSGSKSLGLAGCPCHVPSLGPPKMTVSVESTLKSQPEVKIQ